MKHKTSIHTAFPSALKHEAAAREAGKKERNNPANASHKAERAAWLKIARRVYSRANHPLQEGKSELFWGRQARQLQDAHLAQMKETAAV